MSNQPAKETRGEHREIEATDAGQRNFISWALWLYTLALVALNAIAWTFYFVSKRQPLLRPIFDRQFRYSDLTDYAGKISHLDRGAAALAQGLPVYNYPAPAAYVYALFLRGVPHHSVGAYLAVIFAGILICVFLAWNAVPAHNRARPGLLAAVATSALLGSPLLVAADRGNLEAIVGVVLGAGLVLFTARRYYGSAICIGLAASIKPFPGFFLVLLLRRKLYREFAVGVGVAACTVIVALIALGPTPLAAYNGLEPGVQQYVDHYIMTDRPPGETRFGHSIMDALKSVTNRTSAESDTSHRSAIATQAPSLSETPTAPAEPVHPATHSRRIRVILIVSMLLGVAGFLYALFGIFTLPVLNQMLLVATAITLFPPLASEYTLIHLYVPFGLFLLFLARDVETGLVAFKHRSAILFLTLFALVFSPLSIFSRHYGDVKTILLLGLLIASKTYPMPSSLFGEVCPDGEQPLRRPGSRYNTLPATGISML